MSVGKKIGSCISKIKWVFSVLIGALIGLLLAPKRGREMRTYLKSDKFRNRLKNAGEKGKNALKLARKGTSKLTRNVASLIDKTRAKYGK